MASFDGLKVPQYQHTSGWGSLSTTPTNGVRQPNDSRDFFTTAPNTSAAGFGLTQLQSGSAGAGFPGPIVLGAQLHGAALPYPSSLSRETSDDFGLPGGQQQQQQQAGARGLPPSWFAPAAVPPSMPKPQGFELVDIAKEALTAVMHYLNTVSSSSSSTTTTTTTTWTQLHNDVQALLVDSGMVDGNGQVLDADLVAHVVKGGEFALRRMLPSLCPLLVAEGQSRATLSGVQVAHVAFFGKFVEQALEVCRGLYGASAVPAPWCVAAQLVPAAAASASALAPLPLPSDDRVVAAACTDVGCAMALRAVGLHPDVIQRCLPPLKEWPRAQSGGGRGAFEVLRPPAGSPLAGWTVFAINLSHAGLHDDEWQRLQMVRAAAGAAVHVTTEHAHDRALRKDAVLDVLLALEGVRAAPMYLGPDKAAGDAHGHSALSSLSAPGLGLDDGPADEDPAAELAAKQAEVRRALAAFAKVLAQLKAGTAAKLAEAQRAADAAREAAETAETELATAQAGAAAAAAEETEAEAALQRASEEAMACAREAAEAEAALRKAVEQRLRITSQEDDRVKESEAQHDIAALKVRAAAETVRRIARDMQVAREAEVEDLKDWETRCAAAESKARDAEKEAAAAAAKVESARRSADANVKAAKDAETAVVLEAERCADAAKAAKAKEDAAASQVAAKRAAAGDLDAKRALAEEKRAAANMAQAAVDKAMRADEAMQDRILRASTEEEEDLAEGGAEEAQIGYAGHLQQEGRKRGSRGGRNGWAKRARQ